MRLSILVPIYNEVENLPLLRSALLAALAKVPHDFEIILVNDGSSDGSAELLDKYCGRRFSLLCCPFSPKLWANRCTHGRD